MIMRIRLVSYDLHFDTFHALTQVGTSYDQSALPAAVVAFILNEQTDDPYLWVGREVEVAR